MKAELDALVDQMITRGILFEEAVKEFEKRFILSVVDRHHNNLCRAASELGIHRNTLSKRLQEYQDGNLLYPNLQRRRLVAPRHKSRTE
ncbi:MAG TPA: helix-turn-helix domain-containing protein [Blastocatellia bacterium]|nr:helix-turn-helix domain-containing protein [Blastocatellia bacterium]